jgi:methionyl-tRNA formyltransferase
MPPTLRTLVVSSSAALASAWKNALESRGHAVVAFLTTAGPPRRRLNGYVELVEQFGGAHDVLVSGQPKTWARLFEPYDLDLIACCGFPWRLPADFLALPRQGAINMHPSLLPKYRGAGPNVFGWMFRNDERETGITIHRMAVEFDTGPILAQHAVPIEDDDSARELGLRLGTVMGPALDEAIAKVESGDPGRPQEGGGFYCEAFEDEWRAVDWSRPARSVHNQVRSWTGMETQGHARAEIEGEPVTIKRTRLLGDSSRVAPPGTVIERREEEIVVQCGDGPILVVDWEKR